MQDYLVRVFRAFRGWQTLVHPGLSWVEIESAAVEVDGCLEVFDVSIASDASFYGHDLAVDSFGHGIGDPMSTVAHDVAQTLPDHASHFLHWLQLGMDDAAVPGVEVDCR